MPATDIIKINIAGHGHFQTSAFRFDQLIARYLPASVNDLRTKIEERADGLGIDYSNLSTVTECLMILAEFDGYATN